MDLDYETSFFFSYAKNRRDAGNLKPPGVPPCHLNIYHGAWFHTIECLSCDYFFEREENRYKGTYHFKCHLSKCG